MQMGLPLVCTAGSTPLLAYNAFIHIIKKIDFILRRRFYKNGEFYTCCSNLVIHMLNSID